MLTNHWDEKQTAVDLRMEAAFLILLAYKTGLQHLHSIKKKLKS